MINKDKPFNLLHIWALLVPLTLIGTYQYLTRPKVDESKLSVLVNAHDGKPELSEADARQFAKYSNQFWRDVKPDFEDDGEIDYSRYPQYHLRTALSYYQGVEKLKLERSQK